MHLWLKDGKGTRWTGCRSFPSGCLTPFLSKARNMPSTYCVASSLPVTLKKRLNSCMKSVPLGHPTTNFLYHSCNSATSISPAASTSSQLNCCPILALNVREQGSVSPPRPLLTDSLGEGPFPSSPLFDQDHHCLLGN
jgi:hypothetical protein